MPSIDRDRVFTATPEKADGDTNTIDVSGVSTIIFTKDSSKVDDLIGTYPVSISVGTNNANSTDAYVSDAGVLDVTAYWSRHADSKDVIVIYSAGTIYAPQYSSSLFYGCQKLTTLDLDNLNTSKVTDMGSMFYNCKALTSLNLSNFNTSSVTDMSGMFYACSALTSLNLSNFDTSKVTNMRDMFKFCSKLTSLNLSNFDTSNVTNMFSMFEYCSRLTSLDVSNFNTSNVTEMGVMFGSCSGLTSLNLSNFDTSNVTVMWSMFSECFRLASLNLGNFNLQSCTDFGGMLTPCSALTSITLPYNLQSGQTIELPASNFYNGSAGPYSTIGTATSGTTVACSTASSKVTLTKR